MFKLPRKQRPTEPLDSRGKLLMKKLLYMATLLTALIPSQLIAQQDFSKVEIESTEVRKGIYMLTGSGGNMGLCVGEDATFLIDDQYAPLTDGRPLF